MGKIRLDSILVIDLEQTCWDGEPPPGQVPEIIEIGIADVCLRGEPGIRRSASYLVRPVRSEISPYCTALTGITPAAAHRQGRALREVLATIRKNFGGQAKPWAAWGRDDEDLRADCAAAGLEFPFSDSFINLGQMWSLLTGSSRNVGLDRALEATGIGFEGQRHRAGPDAIAAARVLVRMSEAIRTAFPHPEEEAEPAPGPAP